MGLGERKVDMPTYRLKFNSGIPIFIKAATAEAAYKRAIARFPKRIIKSAAVLTDGKWKPVFVPFWLSQQVKETKEGR